MDQTSEVSCSFRRTVKPSIDIFIGSKKKKTNAIFFCSFSLGYPPPALFNRVLPSYFTPSYLPLPLSKILIQPRINNSAIQRLASSCLFCFLVLFHLLSVYHLFPASSTFTVIAIHCHKEACLSLFYQLRLFLFFLLVVVWSPAVSVELVD
ncbi:hypothetical protein BKA57DRAFT_193132 [Linnemannia elongata]|nr:hypothetical protein BKA57DRAFT_193132 [Linnemannia elongata]